MNYKVMNQSYSQGGERVSNTTDKGFSIYNIPALTGFQFC